MICQNNGKTKKRKAQSELNQRGIKGNNWDREYGQDHMGLSSLCRWKLSQANFEFRTELGKLPNEGDGGWTHRSKARLYESKG